MLQVNLCYKSNIIYIKYEANIINNSDADVHLVYIPSEITVIISGTPSKEDCIGRRRNFITISL